MKSSVYEFLCIFYVVDNVCGSVLHGVASCYDIDGNISPHVGSHTLCSDLLSVIYAFLLSFLSHD